MTDELHEATDVRAFDAFFRELRRGQAHHEMSVALQDLVRAVEETGKAGSVTLTIKLKPDAKYDTAVAVVDEITAKLPQPTKGASLFFMDGSHNLQRSHPNQMTIDDNEEKT